jgi:hypothetical protein
MDDIRLIISPVDYGRKRELMADFVFSNIKVPKGFITDGASIPKICWTIIGHPFGKYLEAAVIHDYLYYRGLLSRKKCDRIFLNDMKKLRIFALQRWAMFRAVRMFGFLGWNNYRKKEEVNKKNEKTN